MHKRRSLFVTGVLLSALVVFGPTTVSAQVANAVLPDANVTAISLDHSRVRVSWDVVTTGQATAANITGFEIRYQEGAAAYDTDERSLAELTAALDDDRIVVDGLEHSTTYTFQVRAVDREGDTAAEMGSTAWAGASVTAETDPAYEPEQVEDLELVPGDMMITAMWDAPESDADFPITGYVLKIMPEDGNEDIMNIGVMTEYEIDRLINGTEYTVAVAARNEIGVGEYSEEEMATPMMPTPALTLFGALALGAGLVTAGRWRLRRRQQLLAR